MNALWEEVDHLLHEVMSELNQLQVLLENSLVRVIDLSCVWQRLLSMHSLDETLNQFEILIEELLLHLLSSLLHMGK